MLFLIRHTVDIVYGKEELGYFSIFVMIIVLYSSIIYAVLMVLLPVLSKEYILKQEKKIFKIVFIMITVIIITAILAVLLCHLIGNWVFSLVFGLTIIPYMYLLFPAVICGALLSIMNLFSICLIAIGKRYLFLISMIYGLLMLIITVEPATQIYGLLGTINIISASFTLIAIIQGIFFLHYMKKTFVKKVKKIC